MHIEAIAVRSSDGFIADLNGDTSLLHSPEDTKLFEEEKLRFHLLVMGRKTYESIKGILKLSPNILRVVLTHSPQQFVCDVIPNKLEFITNDPQNFVRTMEQRGFSSMLVVGGSQVYSEFIRAGVLNRFHITTEQVTLGNGIPVSDVPEFLENAREMKHTILNARGTSHTLYEFNS